MIRKGQAFVIPQMLSNRERLFFLWIEAGAFLMGSPEGEAGRSGSERQFQVKFSHGFWLSKNLVTQAQWQVVMGYNHSKFQQNAEDRPVENVDWSEAMEFCQRLKLDNQITLPEGFQFSLPTQAQWEYACRAGTTTKYFFGEDEADLDRFAWHSGNALGETHPVGLKAPNPLGLHDMYGNVWEWCYDSPEEYPASEVTDWVGRENTETRVVRGGSWKTVVEGGDFRSACRSYWEPQTKRPWGGFRVAIHFVGK